METIKTNNHESESLDLELLKNYIGTPVKLTVAYNEHHCVGEMDDGENHRDINYPPKVFSYPLLGILKTKETNAWKRSSFFILSADERKNVLIPFKYEIKPYWTPGWSCETLTNTIENMVLMDDLKIIPDHYSMFSFNDGAKNVSAYGNYTREDAAALEGITLETYGCKYESDKHIITGDIGKFVNTLIPLWK